MVFQDIESESFDFKKTEEKEVFTHICAMANTSGGYLVLGVDGCTSKKTGSFIAFKKNGFDNDKRKHIETLINNATIHIDPFPKVHFVNVEVSVSLIAFLPELCIE